MINMDDIKAIFSQGIGIMVDWDNLTNDDDEENE